MLELPEWLHEYLMQLSTEQVIEIMADAIDQMQAYNGRSITFCIISSIEGGECIETDTGYTYRLPIIMDKS